VALAAWFHDAVYNGSPADEEDSAALAEQRLENLLPAVDVAEVVRLVRLTATHAPTPADDAGHLLCDADLAVLGGSPGDYSRYVAGVRQDYAHVPEAAFTQGRAAVVRQLLDLEPLFHTERGRELWAVQARQNLTEELQRLTPGSVTH
jgi:predicted metal-dependent HD superfamily phosphohydrolase